MNLEIQSAKLVLSLIDQETGEIITREATLGDFKEVTKKSTSTRTKKKKDDDPNPKATLLEGKLQLNDAAMELTGWEPEMKIDIRFEKRGRNLQPVLVVDDAKGNRLTKSNTISCRGSKHDNLSDFGTIFEVQAYENGMFRLIGDKPLPEDDIIDIPEEISDMEEEDILSDDDIDFNFDD